jgi:signal transduction histidine kinase
MLEVTLSDTVLPAVLGWSGVWSVALVRGWASTGCVVAGIGLVGLFPTGTPNRWYERRVILSVAVGAVSLPVLVSLTRPTMAPGVFPDPGEPVIASPLYLPFAGLAGPIAAGLVAIFPAIVLLGFVMLYARFRRASPDERRRIRWLLIGMTSGFAIFATLFTITWLFDPASAVRVTALLWPLSVVVELGSLLVASSHGSALGIDRPVRRAVVYRVLWAVIAVACIAAAAVLGVLASRFLPIGAAILLAAAAALASQPLQRRLERLADRWVFGARLDSYGVLARFGAALESAPGPGALLPTLAEVARQGLGLAWVRVRLSLPAGAGPSAAATATASATGAMLAPGALPELVVPLTHAGIDLGRIECGPRFDRVLVEEDRRLLGQLAAQAAVAVHERYLSMELANGLEVITRQASELIASRARIAAAQNVERRRIQRDLHDGVQQEVVALAAKLAIVRQRLRRGEVADETLDELQADLHRHLSQLRDVAHGIHPPVLADRGLLEAIEAQASRMPLAVVIEADAALRGIRYPEPVESAAWYLLAEALTNVVKHAEAQQIVVALAERSGQLVVEVRDDGRGFDPTGPRGLGLVGLVDRVDIAGGSLQVCSAPGAGTTLHAELPLAAQPSLSAESSASVGGVPDA